MAGERDLDVLLATLDVERRPGAFTYLELPPAARPPLDAAAMVHEDDTITYVVPMVEGTRPTGFVAAWLTLTVHSALEAVGLTAAVATALAAEGIPANVIAGYRHDHVLVPVDRADAAMDAIRRLSAASRAAGP